MVTIRAVRNLPVIPDELLSNCFRRPGLAILAAAATYASLAPEGFGAFAVIPAIFIAMVVAVPLTPRMS